MNLFVLMEKWCDLNPSLGVTSANSNIIGSLCSTKNSFEVFYYDEWLTNHDQPVDNFIINRCAALQPEALVVSYYPYENDPRNVKLETFRTIRDSGTPVVFIWFDAVHPHIERLAVKCSEYNTLNVIVDCWKTPNEKFLPMTVPQDERLFHWQDHKPHNVCFVGSKGYPERQQYLNFLKNKVNMEVSGGQRENRLTIEEYAQFLKNSKISINFPSKPDGSIQAKARIYESLLCGCLLLERSNDAISRWFEDGKHYVSFANEQDLLKKIRHYLKNESERTAIARAGHDKMQEYRAENWWNKVVARAKELT